jgi:hypothetical protein
MHPIFFCHCKLQRLEIADDETDKQTFATESKTFNILDS